MTAAYPLTWPETIPRTKFRERSKFSTKLPTALKNVEASLRLFSKDSGKAVTSITISSNVTLGRENPADPGVAVWFAWDGLQVCIPVDRYHTVADNLQAIHHVLEARRTEMRHGTLALVRASFQGFRALPPPAGAQAWHQILGVAPTASKDEIEQAYREMAKRSHPDTGDGSHDKMAALNEAKQAGLRSIGAK